MICSVCYVTHCRTELDASVYQYYILSLMHVSNNNSSKNEKTKWQKHQRKRRSFSQTSEGSHAQLSFLSFAINSRKLVFTWTNSLQFTLRVTKSFDHIWWRGCQFVNTPHLSIRLDQCPPFPEISLHQNILRQFRSQLPSEFAESKLFRIPPSQAFRFSLPLFNVT